MPEQPGDLHLEQIVTSDTEQDPVTVYAEHEATMGGAGQHRWITWPVETSPDFESFAVLAGGTRRSGSLSMDWVHRHPRLEAGVRPGAADDHP